MPSDAVIRSGLRVTVRHGSSLAADCQLVYVLPHQGRTLWDEPTAASMETGVLQLQVRNCGTAF